MPAPALCQPLCGAAVPAPALCQPLCGAAVPAPALCQPLSCRHSAGCRRGLTVSAALASHRRPCSRRRVAPATFLFAAGEGVVPGVPPAGPGVPCWAVSSLARSGVPCECNRRWRRAAPCRATVMGARGRTAAATWSCNSDRQPGASPSWGAGCSPPRWQGGAPGRGGERQLQ